MAINLKFDLMGNPEPPSIVLANRNGNKLGQLNVNVESIEVSDKFNDASEFTFTLNKYVDGKLANLWDKVVDFKLVYCKEWDMWFEIKVELDEATETVKTVFCTRLGQAELSQIMLYNIEINTEEDIARDDYKISILYDEDNPKASILHRILSKAPHYSIAYVDETLKRIQRSFSYDDNSICDAFDEVEEEVGCLVVYDSNSDENGMPNRTVSVYDLQQNCNDCGYRGEFTDECPKCGSKNIKYGYGEDTLIFVTADELATEGIQLVTDTDSVKNCFKLEAGDDLMTATIRNCNPNGTDYIWYFSDSVKEDMSKDLVGKIESYDELYKDYYNNHESVLDGNLVNKYNTLVEKYKGYYNTPSTCLNCDYEGDFDSECSQCGSGNILTGKSLQAIPTPITGYSDLMNAYYNTIDLALYLKSGLMPSVEMSETNADEQAKLLTTSSLSPVAVANIDTVSLATANSAVLAMAKIIVRSTFKVQVNNSELSADKKTWTGNFVVTNYSDEEDTAVSEIISVEVSGDNETFIKQKIEKALNKEDTDDYSISGLFEKEYNDFCNELKKYALNPLINFRDACQACIDILMEQGIGDDTTSDLYQNLYSPHYNKLMAIEAEIKVREEEINLIVGVYDTEGNLITEGLQTNIEDCKSQIQNALDFEIYLGEELWSEFSSYRREDKYSNSNYISDGLNNAELFQRALEFIEVAENEIYKSSELQHSISATLNNLLAIPKFKPLVKSFKTGNWIRVQVDERVYKLRLLEYDISYGDFDNISVEFSDVTKIKNGTTDVKDVFAQAASMASSYDSVQRQAKKGDVARSTIDQWLIDGLNSANVEIKNNNSEEVIITKNGLLARSYSDITGTYSPEQLKITHNIMAYTDDNWETVSSALGKHQYQKWHNNQWVTDVDYGLSSKFVTAGYVTGSQIIGGEIVSSNYNLGEESKGTYINLLSGDFEFAGGKIVYDSDKNKVTLSGVTIQWDNVNKPTVDNIDGLSGITDDIRAIEQGLQSTTVNGQYVISPNIVGGYLNIENAENKAGVIIDPNELTNSEYIFRVYKGDTTTVGVGVDGSAMFSGSIVGSSFEGGSLLIGSKNADIYAEINTSGKLTCTGADVTGAITATSGHFDNCTISDTCVIEGLLDGATGSFSGTVSASSIEGSTIKGGSLLIGNDDTGYSAWISDEDGILHANGAIIQGEIHASAGGTIAGWNINEDSIDKKDSDEKSIVGMSSGNSSYTSLVDESTTSPIRFYAGAWGEVSEPIRTQELTFTPAEVGKALTQSISLREDESSSCTIAEAECLTINKLHSGEVSSNVSFIADVPQTTIDNTIYYGSVQVEMFPSWVLASHITSLSCTNTNINLTYLGNGKVMASGSGTLSGARFNGTITGAYEFDEALNVGIALNDSTMDITFVPQTSGVDYSLTIQYIVDVKNQNFRVLEDGSLYANNAKISGTVYATNGVFNGAVYATNGAFTGAVYAESGAIGGLTISEKGISSGSDALTFESDGLVIAQQLEINDYFKANKLQVGKVSGRSLSSPYLDFESAGYDSQVVTVSATVTSKIEGTTGGWFSDYNEGKVTLTINTNVNLINAKTFTITCYYRDNDNYGATYTTTTVTIPSGGNSATVSVPELVVIDMKYDYDRYGHFQYCSSISPDEYTEELPIQISAIASSASLTPINTGLTLGTIDKPWDAIYANAIYNNNSYSLDSTISTSDVNKKNTIKPIEEKYSKLFDVLNPVSFRLNDGTSGRTHIGLIAQELKNSMDICGIDSQDLAAYCSWQDADGNETCGIRYSEFIALCIHEIQKLKTRIAELENK